MAGWTRRSVIAIVSGFVVGNRFLLGLAKRWVAISKKISKVESVSGGPRFSFGPEQQWPGMVSVLGLWATWLSGLRGRRVGLCLPSFPFQWSAIVFSQNCRNSGRLF